MMTISNSQFRMERQRREEEVKTRSSKKGHEAEQAVSNRVSNLNQKKGADSRFCFSFSLVYLLYQASSPQTNSQQAGGSLKSMKEKPSKEEKEEKEGSGLKTAGAEGEITAGMHAIPLTGF